MPRTKRQSRPAATGRSSKARTQARRARTHLPVEQGRTDLRFFRDLISSLATGVLAIQRDGRIALLNDMAYRILSISPADGDVGRPYMGLLRNEPDIARLLAGAFELDHLPNRTEVRLKSAEKVVGCTLSRIYDPRGRATGAALLFKDLTRVEQLEERERLRDRLAALGEMAAAIAHEVKNPLASIEVMAGVLKRQLAGSEDAQVILNDIINESKMANAIVLEVLEFVRPIRLQVEPVPVPAIVHDALAAAEGIAPSGYVSVLIYGIDGDLPTIEGDALQLRQLFTNLLTNAFEALDGRGTVWIRGKVLAADEDHASAGESPGRLVIEVEDSGPGLSPDVIDRIFSPFFTTKPKGSGLGLAIVRKIVDAHDGHIDVSAPPGAGTRFRVTLPTVGSRASQE